MAKQARLPDNPKRKHTYTVHPIPETGYVRLPSILAVYPVSASTWWAGVKSGKFPRPVKLAERTTAWKAEDIHALLREAA